METFEHTDEIQRTLVKYKEIESNFPVQYRESYLFLSMNESLLPKKMKNAVRGHHYAALKLYMDAFPYSSMHADLMAAFAEVGDVESMEKGLSLIPSDKSYSTMSFAGLQLTPLELAVGILCDKVRDAACTETIAKALKIVRIMIRLPGTDLSNSESCMSRISGSPPFYFEFNQPVTEELMQRWNSGSEILSDVMIDLVKHGMPYDGTGLVNNILHYGAHLLGFLRFLALEKGFNVQMRRFQKGWYIPDSVIDACESELKQIQKEQRMLK